MKHEYKHFSELKKKLRLIVCTHNKLPKAGLANEALALVTRSGNANSCYKIYTSEFCSGKSFLMHEIGHIVFQHLRYEEALNQQIEAKLRGTWKSFSKYISFARATELRTMKSLIHLLKNYAMDMEVNSKVFDEGEKQFVLEDLNLAERKRLSFIVDNKLPGRSIAAKKLALYFYARQRDPKAYLITPVFAEDYGFPRGLSWQHYIDLIIMNPDSVMQRICERLRSEQRQLLEKGSKIPGEVIRRAACTSDMADELSAEVLRKTEGESTGIQPGKTKSFTINKLGPEVSRFITDRAVDNFEDIRTDYLYLANRGKAGNILRGKTIEHSDYVQGNVHVIVDTSGSVKEESLAQLLDLFSEIKNRVGEQSKVIFWDTDLKRIDSLREGIKEIPKGGGTKIAPAIKYTASRFCSENDKLFIISDYFDYLDEWLTEIRKLRCSCYGICWTDNRTKLSGLHKEKFYAFCKEVETLFVAL